MLPPSFNFFNYLQRPLRSQEPAYGLIRRIARKQWRLIGLNMGSSLAQAITEGATLGVVFLAVEVLSAPVGSPFNWVTIPALNLIPGLQGRLNELPSTVLFLCLLGLSVLLQAFQSLTKYLNNLSVGYFSARCRVVVTSLIHHQVLEFSFPFASEYKIGDLSNYAGQCPLAIKNQIEYLSNMVVGMCLCATYLIVLISISPWLLCAVLIMGILIGILQKHLMPRIRTGSKVVEHAQVEVTNQLIENFQGLRLLHSAGQLDAADDRIRAGLRNL